jgi:hypothetical protein
VPQGREMTAHYFLCSGGTGAVSIKSTLGQVTLNLCFAFGGICGSRSALQCIRVLKRRCTILHAHVRPVRIPQKAQLGHVKPNLCLASGRIRGSRSAFWCILDAKCRRTIFLAWVGLVRIAQKRVRTPCAELVFLPPGRKTLAH